MEGEGGVKQEKWEREKEKLWMDGMWEGGEEDFDWGDGEGTKGKGGERKHTKFITLDTPNILFGNCKYD